ncbi:unnamed protein product [Caenorhabditis angaria]|uniref:Guanylate cyclase n=1 Tax=Caenorhabditis angaria TaxID=860376 RepID=A0A9P1N6X2_9PELO|nr:unnamed protein product [Caenorhabditis angaria]
MTTNLFFILLYLLINYRLCQNNIIHFGFLHCDDVDGTTTYINYRTSASAANIAMDRLKSEGLLHGYEFKMTILFDNCDEVESTGKTQELIKTHNVDVIIGPTTNYPAVPAFTLATFHNIPIIAWGLTSAGYLDDNSRFPSSGLMSVGSGSLSIAFRLMMKEYGWDQFVFVFSLVGDQEKCATLRDDLQDMVSYFGDITMSYSRQITEHTDAAMTAALKDIATRGRIIVVCFNNGNSDGSNRQFFINANKLGYDNDEFVYILPALKSKGYGVLQTDGTRRMPWVLASGAQDTDSLAIPGFQRSFAIVDMQGQGQVSANFSTFLAEVISRMKLYPYNCTTECEGAAYQVAATYCGQLHDAVYAYGVTLDKVIKTNATQYKNGTYIISKMQQNFTGASGPVYLNKNGVRNPTLYIVNLSSNMTSTTISTVYVDGQVGVMTKMYTNESSQLWHFRSNMQRPLDEPLCGFTGTNCPENVFIQYMAWFIIAIVIIVLAICGAISAIVTMIRAKQQEIERQNALWQIPFNTMKPITKKNKGDNSMRSISSGPSTISSTKSTLSEVTEKRHFLFFTIQNEFESEKVAARKHVVRPIFDTKECAFMRQMRLIDHANLNKFIGMSLDAPQLMSVWRFCARGSLADVIQKATIQMDGFFIYSLMKDIMNGLNYIHDSNIEYHGMLTSKSCLLNDRWQLKITDYGIKQIRMSDQFNKTDLLWTAPELLRSGDLMGSKEGDIYSFGIISSEMVTRKSVFDIENRKEDAEEIIYMLKKGGMRSPRPDLDHDDTIELNPALLHLIRDCWTERPSERPNIKEVMSQLRGMNNNRNDNLMDHVFNVLESYASTLEDEVAERMKELVEEKKKSDLLLYRMLPKQVADKLKLGQTVEPETFDLVTLFFSDVVSFTTLAGKCTPLQVVNLLNDLYTIFDGIIDQHDVYKVETIGDGYLVVSGLPHRNGNEHSRHIASMSIAFISSLTNFRIPHLPNEKINIRVGFHCGSVVSGVVGLTMPRYCLFGDAVNTASRMESNSKPGQIHISSEANDQLIKLGGFTTEPRGEVIVKGKGVMNTYWLLKMSPAAAPKLNNKTD